MGNRLPHGLGGRGHWGNVTGDEGGGQSLGRVVQWAERIVRKIDDVFLKLGYR